MGIFRGGGIVALEIEDLLSVEEEVKMYLAENLEKVLINLNRQERLFEFLSLIEAEHLCKATPLYETHKNGTIIVIGASRVKEKDLRKIAKSLGITEDRLECHLDYTRIPDLSYIQGHPNYSVILVGPMPHSTEGRSGYSSTLVRWEQEEGFPPVRRLGTNELKITKSSFQQALQQLLNSGVITADFHGAQ